MMKLACDRCGSDQDMVTFTASYRNSPPDILAKKVAERPQFDLCVACLASLTEWFHSK
jgi:hypothetical protein